ncbi:MAG: alpha/beta hydrolase [Acidobacteria bacterium]|nr:alpha/beta hydrolase [Acidobacteriota bacterium]
MPHSKYISLIIIIFSLSIAVHAQDIPSFNVVRAGSGTQNVIFLAGLGTSDKVWDETMRSLCKTRSCYALSFSGFAGNAAQDDPSMLRWENDVVEFIKSNEIDSPTLIGHSFGGTLALKIAADHPKIIQRLVIVDAFPSPGALQNPNFKSRKNVDCSPYIKQFETMGDIQFLNYMRSMVSQMVTQKAKVEKVLSWFVKSDRQTFGEIYCELMNTDIRENLSSIVSPTLIMLEPSFKSKETDVKAQYVSLNGAEFRFAPKGLHFLMYDDEDWFLETLKSFLDK